MDFGQSQKKQEAIEKLIFNFDNLVTKRVTSELINTN